MKRMIAIVLSAILLTGSLLLLVPEFESSDRAQAAASDTITLRVCNWEEYIDEGDWDEDEVIDLESGDIFGENSMVEDFEEWYEETYGVKVNVEYSCFGTNEELYNMMTLGNVYDLVCPSDYLIMKLMDEGELVAYSDSFFDENVEENYFIKGVSPFIKDVFDSNEINGEPWSKYAAGYMCGVTGILYNPEIMTREDASTWTVINNPDYFRKITIKDNVRDSMFAAVGAVKSELLSSAEFLESEDYSARLLAEMNDTSEETLAKVQDYLQDSKDNVYAFETDAGKADMITGKIAANYQWSGDAVYAMDQAEEDDCYLEFAVPEECTDLWYDGWVMLKDGVEGDAAKQQAAEAFVNFLSRPDNAIRNMYYIGYTSVITGSDDGRILEYLDWNYGAEEEDETAVEYSVGTFFVNDEEDEDYILMVPEEQTYRQLFAQYPPTEVLNRSSIMDFFDAEEQQRVNQMWINVRCYNLKDVPVWAWILGVAILGGLIFLLIRVRKLND